MTGVQRIASADQPVMPWANGGGVTRQVAIDPPGSSLAAGCRWRVSRAQVASDGPFSLLPGFDRTLWLLAGAGMRLQLPDREVVLDRPGQRFDFAGETAMAARLLDGPCEDLNVMVARERVRGARSIVGLANGEELQVAAGGQRLVVVLRGLLTMPRRRLVVAAGEALLDDRAADLAAIAVEPCTLLVCTFLARAPTAS